MTQFHHALAAIQSGVSVSAQDMEAAMDDIVERNISEDEIVQFLESLRDKGETEAELAGLVMAMRKRMRKIDLGADDFIDTCGTGGTGKKRFNISTAASFLAAAAGAKIAKHGNRGASSRSGSADFLEALGYPLNLSEAELQTHFRRTNFCFFFAPSFHPAMAKVAGARRRIGTKTIFNCLGPLLNPAGAKRQIIGVYSRERMALMAKVIATDSSAEAMLLHGDDGMDEITLTDKTHVLHVRDGAITSMELDPHSYGYAYCNEKSLEGGTAVENADRFKRMCAGEDVSALFDCIRLNAAFIYAFARHESFASAHLQHILSSDSRRSLDLLKEPPKTSSPRKRGSTSA